MRLVPAIPAAITLLVVGIVPSHVAIAGPASAACANAASRSDRDVKLFPVLNRIRDRAIELVFGRHPTRVKSDIFSKAEPRTDHANEVVLRFNVTTLDEEKALAEAAARLFLDVWAFTSDFVDLRIHTDAVAPLLRLLPPSLRTAHSTLIADVAAAVYESYSARGGDMVPTQSSRPATNGPAWAEDNLFFQDYQPLSVITRWLRLLEAMFPAHVELISIGNSFEGRDIPALRVGLTKLSNTAKPRKTIVVTGGMHAREWISTSTVNYLAWSFITSFGKDPAITKVLEEFDIVFVPVMNPDGVEYTWSVDRLWRKSRQETTFRYCRGMDLDHAFGFEFDVAQIQSDPCSESYGGELPFQAVEAQELANWAKNETFHNVQFVGLLDLHSYSQQVLFPYAYSCTHSPPNLENLEELGAGLSKAIRLSHGEAYSVTSACEGAVARSESLKGDTRLRVESGGGSAIDWFYHELGAHFSYQIKLRDTGSYGFLLPKEQIIPTGEETLNAMKYFGDYLLGNNGIEKHFGPSMEEVGPNDDDRDSEDGFGVELRKYRVRR